MNRNMLSFILARTRKTVVECLMNNLPVVSSRLDRTVREWLTERSDQALILAHITLALHGPEQGAPDAVRDLLRLGMDAAHVVDWCLEAAPARAAAVLNTLSEQAGQPWHTLEVDAPLPAVHMALLHENEPGEWAELLLAGGWNPLDRLAQIRETVNANLRTERHWSLREPTVTPLALCLEHGSIGAADVLWPSVATDSASVQEALGAVARWMCIDPESSLGWSWVERLLDAGANPHLGEVAMPAWRRQHTQDEDTAWMTLTPAESLTLAVLVTADPERAADVWARIKQDIAPQAWEARYANECPLTRGLQWMAEDDHPVRREALAVLRQTPCLPDAGVMAVRGIQFILDQGVNAQTDPKAFEQDLMAHVPWKASSLTATLLDRANTETMWLFDWLADSYPESPQMVAEQARRRMEQVLEAKKEYTMSRCPEWWAQAMPEQEGVKWQAFCAQLKQLLREHKVKTPFELPTTAREQITLLWGLDEEAQAAPARPRL
jgi:hypothetical protein